MKVTTALRKISGLKKKIWGIQGGQGAGKTYSILLIIINHALSNKAREIYIASSELTKMRDTVIKDAINICEALGIQYTATGILHGSPRIDFNGSGSFIRFLGFDKDDIGKGLRSDVFFVNEANKVNFEAYREATSRAKRVIIDFNPNKKFWFHTEVMTRDDCDFLKLTFQDNEFLSAEERNEILRYKSKGYKLKPDGSIQMDANGNRVVLSQYWANMWRVYGEGEVGTVEGRIYFWDRISLDDYHKINAPVYYGVDWGKVDPFAVIEAKYYDGNLYVHELNYASENELEASMSVSDLHAMRAQPDEGLVMWLFNKLGVKRNSLIVCDSNRPNKIIALRRAGWDYAEGIGAKARIIDRVGMLAGLNIYYTSTSLNIETEQESYCYERRTIGGQMVTLEEPVDRDNHTINAIEYLAQKLFEKGIIRKA